MVINDVQKEKLLLNEKDSIKREKFDQKLEIVLKLKKI